MGKSTNFEIKTTLAIDGEKKFKAAMDDANRSMRVMDSEMKKVEAAYQAGGSGAEYYAQKSRILKDEIEQQKAIINALSNAVKEATTKYGAASKEVQTYKIKQNQAEAALSKLTKESKKARKETEELGDDAKKAGKEIKDGLGKATEETSKDVEGAFKRISEKMDKLKQSASVQAAISVGRFVLDSIQGVTNFVSENAELSQQIAIARYNIERYGLDWNDVDDLIISAAAVTGDREGAMSAVTSLVQAGIADGEMLSAVMDALVGGFLLRPGLSYETLAEDFLGSVNTRELTGSMQELIEEVLGLSLEDVNNALADATSQEEAMQILTSFLTERGLQDYAQEFRNNNQQLIEYQQAALEMTESWRQLSETLMPLVTEIINVMRNIVDFVTETVESSGIMRIAEARSAGRNLTDIQEELLASGAATQEQIDEMRSAIRLTQFLNIMDLLTPGANIQPREERERGRLWEWLFPSAGAEEMPEGWEQYGQQAYTEFEAGFDGAQEAGTSMMQQFGAGIDEATPAVLDSVGSMVNQINGMLGSVTIPSFGYGGVSGGNVSLIVDGQELGRVTAQGVSSSLGRQVATRMLVD